MLSFCSCASNMELKNPYLLQLQLRCVWPLNESGREMIWGVVGYKSSVCQSWNISSVKSELAVRVRTKKCKKTEKTVSGAAGHVLFKLLSCLGNNDKIHTDVAQPPFLLFIPSCLVRSKQLHEEMSKWPFISVIHPQTSQRYSRILLSQWMTFNILTGILDLTAVHDS